MLVRDVGVGLAILGAIVLSMHFLWSVMCGADLMGPCMGQPYSERQASLGLVGLALLAVGLVLALLGPRTLRRPRIVPSGKSEPAVGLEGRPP